MGRGQGADRGTKWKSQRLHHVLFTCVLGMQIRSSWSEARQQQTGPGGLPVGGGISVGSRQPIPTSRPDMLRATCHMPVNKRACGLQEGTT